MKRFALLAMLLGVVIFVLGCPQAEAPKGPEGPGEGYGAPEDENGPEEGVPKEGKPEEGVPEEKTPEELKKIEFPTVDEAAAKKKADDEAAAKEKPEAAAP
jgi:hypothetical protein